MNSVFSKSCILNFILLFIASAGFSADLPVLNIDPSQVSISGLSSGAFMAVQMHVAYSSLFSGVGVFAGGIYDCAENSQITAQINCITTPSQLDSSHYVSIARQEESLGNIDPLSNLSKSRVYLFSGTKDTVVNPIATQKLKEFYSQFMDPSQIAVTSDIPAAHGQPTLDYGNDCGTFGSPFIQNCGYDGAGSAFNQIYDSLKSRGVASPNNFSAFDQSHYGSSEAQLANEGYVYVPSRCVDGKTACRLHVALHGCQQNPDTVGDSYRAHAGYNEWAETNNIVVLYPSASASGFANLKGCWDWWGYTGPDYFRKSGPQMQAIQKMVTHLMGQ